MTGDGTDEAEETGNWAAMGGKSKRHPESHLFMSKRVERHFILTFQRYSLSILVPTQHLNLVALASRSTVWGPAACPTGSWSTSQSSASFSLSVP